MTNSMTAFARVQNQIGSIMLCWEIKSINHRYLDVSFRLPEAVRYLEPKLRLVLSNGVSRGKLECQLKITHGVDSQPALQVNKSLIQALVAAADNLATDYQLANDLTVSTVLSWPEVIQNESQDMELLSKKVEQTFSEAVQHLQAARKIEGSRLREMIETRLQLLNHEIQRAKKISENLPVHAKEKLIARLQQFHTEFGDLRIEQEIALMLTRFDVSEELDRLVAHVDEVKRTLGKEQIAGRRLDFLMQELNREANTLSSKSDNIELTQCAVEMKVLIEQMREQIQNIE